MTKVTTFSMFCYCHLFSIFQRAFILLMSINSWDYMFYFTNAPYWVCFSFCLDAKRNKRSRLSLFARPATDSKAKTKEKRLSLISFCFLTLSFALRVPRATAKVGSLTDKSHLHASALVHQRHSRWLTSEAGVKLNVP